MVTMMAMKHQIDMLTATLQVSFLVWVYKVAVVLLSVPIGCRYVVMSSFAHNISTSFEKLSNRYINIYTRYIMQTMFESLYNYDAISSATGATDCMF